MPNIVRAPFGSPEYPADLIGFGDTLGVRAEPPYGHVHTHTRDGRTASTVGQLIATAGIIHMIPRHNLTNTQLGYLAAAAEDAFFTPPSIENGWELSLIDDQMRWTTSITITTRCAPQANPDSDLIGQPSIPANPIQGAA